MTINFDIIINMFTYISIPFTKGQNEKITQLLGVPLILLGASSNALLLFIVWATCSKITYFLQNKIIVLHC